MSFGRRWRDLNDELEAHHRLAAGDGFPPGSRDRAPEGTREAVRAQWAWVWLDDAARDLRFAARGLHRSPGFAATAILTLALGIAATAAMFSLVSGIVLRPLPYPQPQRLVAASDNYPAGAFAFLRARSHTLDLAAYTPDRSFNIETDAQPEIWTGSTVAANFFSVLGIAPLLGRTFAPGDDQPGRDHEVVLSEPMWRQRFHADRAVLGRNIEVDAVEREIIGVMPASFRFPSAQTRLWIPLRLNPSDRGAYWAGSYMPLLGRLRPGATMASAQAQWRNLRPQLLAAYGWPMPKNTFRSVTLLPLRTALIGSAGARLWLLFAAVSLLLLIAGVNVSQLLLARAATRQREMDLRAALGASNGRMLRQLLAENCLLAAAGGVLGVAIAWLALPLLKHWLPQDLPRLAGVSLDGRVLALAVLLSGLCALAFGLCGHSSLYRRPQRARRLNASALVVAEVALSALLVAAAGLNARSLMRLAAMNPGFHAAAVLTARLAPNPAQCQPAARCQALYSAVIARLSALPGVLNAAAVNGLPLGGELEATTFQVDGRLIPPGQRHPLALGQIVTPGYFAALGIPLLRGRRFTVADAAPGAAPVVILSRSTAARLWKGEPVLGRLFKPDGERQWHRVIGIVGDVRTSALPAAGRPWLYTGVYSLYAHPMLACAPCHSPPTNLTLVLRSAPGHIPDAATLRATVAQAAPGAALNRIEPLAQWSTAALQTPRSTTWLFALAAALALVLGAAGLYGLLAYQVSQRRREIGIRMALGARASSVLAAVARRGLRLAAIGIAAGLLAALLTGQLLAGLLYGFNPRDPLTFAAVAGLWLLVALAASWLPARRAARIDPARTLRCE
ncbi:MAG: ABC transporter permease [Terriglobales bacterium]